MKMKDTIRTIKQFNRDREWDKFHAPNNLAKSIVIEAAELLECFQWNNEEYNKQDVCDELADVMIYCIQMADVINVDMETIINEKMEKNAKKYPIEKSKGNCKKYNEF